MENIAENANNPLPSDPVTSKFCAKCKNLLDAGEFYKNALNRDGLDSYCKPCKAAYHQERKESKKLLSFKQVSSHQKFWLQENKLKKTAHQKVAYAIQKGELIRQPCEKCGTEEHVVAHHEDYNKPLDVVWLCKFHHKERHSELDRMEKPKPDMINHPPHYTHGGIETIVYIKAKLSPEEYVGYLRGNIFKYTSRIGLKGESNEDAGKIEFYSKELNKFLNEG
jgi:DNA-directed RNA polymerase subunit M/transcription elongation factor TFIIS